MGPSSGAEHRARHRFIELSSLFEGHLGQYADRAVLLQAEHHGAEVVDRIALNIGDPRFAQLLHLSTRTRAGLVLPYDDPDLLAVRELDLADELGTHAVGAWVPGHCQAGVTVFELARVMGTSVAMIERHYGTLLDGAGAGIAGRLDAHEAQLEQNTM